MTRLTSIQSDGASGTICSGFGIGIARGHATIGRIGFDQRSDYAVIGTVSNHAARLCEEAKSRQILVSQRVLGAVESWSNPFLLAN